MTSFPVCAYVACSATTTIEVDAGSGTGKTSSAPTTARTTSSGPPGSLEEEGDEDVSPHTHLQLNHHTARQTSYSVASRPGCAATSCVLSAAPRSICDDRSRHRKWWRRRRQSGFRRRRRRRCRRGRRAEGVETRSGRGFGDGGKTGNVRRKDHRRLERRQSTSRSRDFHRQMSLLSQLTDSPRHLPNIITTYFQ